jgi:hypothetical protein
VFNMLYALGKEASCLILCVNTLASLYAGAPHQFTTRLMGWSGLCIFIRPLIVGAEGFRLMHFHLVSCGISSLLSFIFLIWVLKVLVGYVVLVWKSFACIKSCILESYYWMGRITMELPLSALVIIALFFWIFIFIVFIVLASECLLWLESRLSFCYRVLMRSATNFLYALRSGVGSFDIVVPASRARFCIQFSCCCVGCT